VLFIRATLSFACNRAYQEPR